MSAEDFIAVVKICESGDVAALHEYFDSCRLLSGVSLIHYLQETVQCVLVLITFDLNHCIRFSARNWTAAFCD